MQERYLKDDKSKFAIVDLTLELLWLFLDAQNQPRDKRPLEATF